MKHPHAIAACCVAAICAASIAVAPAARGDTATLNASDTGKVIDWGTPAAPYDPPLDGVGDEALSGGPSTIDLTLDAISPFDPELREDRAVFEYDITSLHGSTVTAATFNFGIYATVGGTINLYSYAGDGAVGLDDFPQLGDLVATVALTDAATTIDVTAALNAAVVAADTYFGLLLTLTAEDQMLSIHHAGTGEIEDPGVPDPYLDVTFTPAVPAPASAAMLLGLAAPLAIRRRRIV